MISSTEQELAINGGKPVRTTPWPMRHLFGTEEKQAAIDVLDKWSRVGGSGYGGEDDQGYCEDFARYMGGGYADAVNSGSTAVYVALRALEIEPFGEVIVSAITDPGGVMPVALINCVPVPADTMPRSYNTGAEQIAARITPRTRAIVVAHIAGLPVEMQAVMTLAKARHIPVIEDCAQAHGARLNGKLLGTFGDIAAFSTMAGKHHATGGQGGLVYTADQELYWRARRVSDRGKPFNMPGAAGNLTATMNFNQSDLQAAIGRAQLKKLPAMIEARRRFALAVAQGCQSLKSVKVQTGCPGAHSVFWFLVLEFDGSHLRVDKNRFMEALVAEGVSVGNYVGSFSHAPWYQHRRVFGTTGLPWTAPQYQGQPDQEYPTPNCDALPLSLIRLGMHEGYGAQEAADVLAALAKVEKAFLK